MEDRIDLKALERKAYTSTFQDGILDIYLGLFLLAMGLAPVLEAQLSLADWWTGILMIPPMIGFWAGKKHITRPRMGLVVFGPERKAKMKRLSVLFIFPLLLGLALFAAISFSLIPERALAASGVPVLAWTLVCIIGFCCAAGYLNLARFYLYGLLFAAPFPFRILMREDAAWRHYSYYGFYLSGLIVLTIGVVVLIRFLRRYPLPGEMTDVTS